MKPCFYLFAFLLFGINTIQAQAACIGSIQQGLEQSKVTCTNKGAISLVFSENNPTVSAGDFLISYTVSNVPPSNTNNSGVFLTTQLSVNETGITITDVDAGIYSLEIKYKECGVYAINNITVEHYQYNVTDNYAYFIENEALIGESMIFCQSENPTIATLQSRVIGDGPAFQINQNTISPAEYTINWYFNSKNISLTSKIPYDGQYYVEIKDKNGCVILKTQPHSVKISSFYIPFDDIRTEVFCARNSPTIKDLKNRRSEKLKGYITPNSFIKVVCISDVNIDDYRLIEDYDLDENTPLIDNKVYNVVCMRVTNDINYNPSSISCLGLQEVVSVSIDKASNVGEFTEDKFTYIFDSTNKSLNVTSPAQKQYMGIDYGSVDSYYVYYNTYEYAIDDLPYRQYNKFENIEPGNHILKVREILKPCNESFANLTITQTISEPIITFADNDFKKVFLNDPKINTNLDSEIQLSEAPNVTSIKLFFNINIQPWDNPNNRIGSIKGIENFINLTQFSSVNENYVRDYDLLSQLTNLNSIHIGTEDYLGFDFTLLDFSNLKNLTSVSFDDAYGAIINIKNENNSKLTYVKISGAKCIEVDDPNDEIWKATCLDFYTFEDIVCVEGINPDGCTQTLNLTKENFKESISIAPNPAQNEITISGLSNNNSIIVYDISGREILSLNTTGANPTIDISALTKGTYILKINSENGNTNSKFIKE